MLAIVPAVTSILLFKISASFILGDSAKGRDKFKRQKVNVEGEACREPPYTEIWFCSQMDAREAVEIGTGNSRPNSRRSTGVALVSLVMKEKSAF